MATRIYSAGGGNSTKKIPIYEKGRWNNEVLNIITSSGISWNANHLVIAANGYINCNYAKIKSAYSGNIRFTIITDINTTLNRVNLSLWGHQALNYEITKKSYNIQDMISQVIVSTENGVANEGVFLLCSGWYGTSGINCKVKGIYMEILKERL